IRLHQKYCFDKYSLHSYFFIYDPVTTDIYTLSLHDALPICARRAILLHGFVGRDVGAHLSRITVETYLCSEGANKFRGITVGGRDRKSTRLNSSHLVISYAVFCLKKKNIK